MTYRHCTNLFTPYSDVDQRFLDVLEDYRVGDPIEATPVAGASWTPRTVAEMKADGVVGIYATLERLDDGKVRGLTGWQQPQRILGPALSG